MYKSEIVKVNLSSSFVYRTICLKCGSRPLYYYYTRNPIMWYDPHKNRDIFDFIRKYFKRLSPDNYSLDDFVYSSKIGYYNHPVNYKGYKPKLHRTRGVDPILDLVEHLTCNCGYTVWSFSDKSVRSRPEINNRKCKYKHSNKFVF